MKFSFFSILICTILLIQTSSSAALSGEAANALEWSLRMVDSEMNRNPNGYTQWGYVYGTLLHAFDETYRTTGTHSYYDFIEKSVDNVVKQNGSITGYFESNYSLDAVNEGRVTMMLFEKTQDMRYKTAIDKLITQIKAQPRTTDSGFWHKNSYPYQMWLDGLYMGSTFYAEYAKAFNKPEYYDDVFRQIALMEKHMRDPNTGLLYHGWEDNNPNVDTAIYWADPVTGCSKSFWGRAMGWYMMGVAEILDSLPSDYQHRDSIIHIYQRLAAAVVKYQDSSSGVWWQIVDKGTISGNYLESSASCMFVYGLAKGIRMGYLNSSEYIQSVEKGYNGLIKQFITGSSMISLNGICQTAGLGTLNGQIRDGSFEYYTEDESIVSNDGKGVGPFILAGLEVDKTNKTSINKQQHSQTVKKTFSTKLTKNKFGSELLIYASKPAPVQYALYSVRGDQVYATRFDVSSGRNELPLYNTNISSGRYVEILSINNTAVSTSMALIP